PRLIAWRDRLKKVEKDNLPPEWIPANPPTGCPQADWIAYLEHEEYITLVERNKANRKLQQENHHGGRRPWDRYIEETLQKTGKRPSRGQMFQHFFRLPDGSYISEHARMVAVTITRLDAERAPTEWGPNDSLVEVLNNSILRSHMGFHPSHLEHVRRRHKYLRLKVDLGRSLFHIRRSTLPVPGCTTSRLPLPSLTQLVLIFQ
ncbi:hypothetical protein LINGRAHAP2_LOCUS30090, partial [Linum grandiflorum]